MSPLGGQGSCPWSEWKLLHLRTGPGLLVSGPSVVWSCPQQNEGLWQGESLTSGPTARPCSKRNYEDRATWHSSSVLVSSRIKHSNNGIVMEKNTINGYLQHLWHLPYAQCNHSWKHIFIHAYKYINYVFLRLPNGSKILKKSLEQKRA